MLKTTGVDTCALQQPVVQSRVRCNCEEELTALRERVKELEGEVRRLNRWLALHRAGEILQRAEASEQQIDMLVEQLNSMTNQLDRAEDKVEAAEANEKKLRIRLDVARNVKDDYEAKAKQLAGSLLIAHAKIIVACTDNSTGKYDNNECACTICLLAKEVLG
jgi:DNA repair exonuclease SbcCD ATPase subunit